MNSWIEVFQWTECSSEDLMIASIRIKEGMQTRKGNGIYFIGEDRVLCITRYDIFIHKIPPLSHVRIDWDPTTGYHTDDNITEPLWTYSEKSLNLANSISFAFDGVDYRLVFRNGSTIIGICIPLSSSDQPSVQLRISLDCSSPVMVGLHKGCSFSGNGAVVRYGYSWCNGERMVVNNQGQTDPVTECVFFDEETGRCIALKQLDRVQVVDFFSY